MSIYTDEGVPMMAAIELAIRDHVEGGTTWPANEDGSEITVALQGGTWLCTIRESGSDFEVAVEGGDTTVYVGRLSHILARVRELAKAAREKPVEEAPAEPTLRGFLVEFRKWINGEDGISVLADWLDARLGKEESDG